MSQTANLIEFLSAGYHGCEWHQVMIEKLCQHATGMINTMEITDRISLAVELRKYQIRPIQALSRALVTEIEPAAIKARASEILTKNSSPNNRENVDMCVKVLQHASVCRDGHCGALACQK